MNTTTLSGVIAPVGLIPADIQHNNQKNNVFLSSESVWPPLSEYIVASHYGSAPGHHTNQSLEPYVSVASFGSAPAKTGLKWTPKITGGGRNQ